MMKYVILILGIFTTSTISNGDGLQNMIYQHSFQIQLSNNEIRFDFQTVFCNTNGLLLSLEKNYYIFFIYIEESGGKIRISFYNNSEENNIIGNISISEFCDYPLFIYEIVKFTIILSNKSIILECKNKRNKIDPIPNLPINNQNVTVNLVGRQKVTKNDAPTEDDLQVFIKYLRINGEPIKLSNPLKKVENLDLDGVFCIRLPGIYICNLTKTYLNDKEIPDNSMKQFLHNIPRSEIIFIENKDRLDEIYKVDTIRNISNGNSIIMLTSNKKKSLKEKSIHHVQPTITTNIALSIIIIAVALSIIIIAAIKLCNKKKFPCRKGQQFQVPMYI